MNNFRSNNLHTALLLHLLLNEQVSFAVQNTGSGK